MSDQPALQLWEMFEDPAPDAWRRAAQQALGGAPLSKLVRTHADGVEIAPIYEREALDRAPHAASLPGQSPYVRGAQALGSRDWVVRAQLDCGAGPVAWNARARQEVAGGVGGLGLELHGSGWTMEDLQRALSGLPLQELELDLGLWGGGSAHASHALMAMLSLGVDGAALRGTLGLDPLGDLCRRGGVDTSLPARLGEMAQLLHERASIAGALGVAVAHGEPYHDAGAGAVQELGFAVATAASYLRAAVDRGVDPDLAAAGISLSLSVGPRFFTEVARLRAARLLWDLVTHAFGCARRALTVHVRTSAWSASAVDPWVNMLRGTMEAFAAVAGGAQSVTVVPFDQAVGEPDPFSRRIARNVQHILREEAYLDRVVDPAGGAWMVESLTDQIGAEAWRLVQQVEELGGMTEALKRGYPQREVSEVAARREQRIATRRLAFVGATVFGDPDERPLDRPRRPAARVVTPLRPVRATVPFEEVRAAAGGRRALVVLVDGAPRSRAEFAAEVMRTGGFNVETADGLQDAEAVVDAVRQARAAALVLCARDDAYPAMVPQVVARLGESDAALVVAGRPPGARESWAEGVDQFIHRGTDLLAALRHVLRHGAPQGGERGEVSR